MTQRMYLTGSPRERFQQRVIVMPSGCWEWNGCIDRNGYARFNSGERVVFVHRWAYEEFVGLIADGLTIDHLCRNRGCVNPTHLEPVTHAENMARSAPATKTTCVNGHVYTPENTYVRPSGQRDCRTCIRERQRRRVARKKLAA